MRFFDFKCSCGERVEVNDPNPPLCPCGNRMIRVFTPPQVSVRDGTPTFYGTRHDTDEKKEIDQGISEYETEQKTLRDGMRKRKEADKKAFKEYCAGELHIKHGKPDESTTALPQSIKD
jgi:hypothetical protein